MNKIQPPAPAAEIRPLAEAVVAASADAMLAVDARGRVVLFNPAAERMFGVVAAEALDAPLAHFISDEAPGLADGLRSAEGRRADGQVFPVEASVSRTGVGAQSLTIVTLRDATERQANDEARRRLAREVDHRAKNALAVVQALVGLTEADTKADFMRAVRGRVSALARAHALLAQGGWQGVDLAEILGEEVRAQGRPEQAALSGPRVRIAPDAVQPLMLVAHELATNAARHGAFADGDGRLSVAWRLGPDDGVALRWRESGVAGVTPPEALGFGSTLVRQVVTRQLGGVLAVEWGAEGASVDISLPAAVVQDRGRGTPRPSPASPMRSGPARPTGARVLLVEDERLVALEAAAALTDLGWTVMGPVGEIAEALTLIAADPGPDFAVLDVNLHGQAVYPIAEALAARGVPFLFCTGYESVDPEGRFEGTPMLQKPVDPALLDARLAELAAART